MTKLASYSCFKQVEILLIGLEEIVRSYTVYAQSVSLLACTHAGSHRRHSSIAMSITVVPWRANRHLIISPYLRPPYSPDLNLSGYIFWGIIRQCEYHTFQVLPPNLWLTGDHLWVNCPLWNSQLSLASLWGSVNGY